MKSSERAKTCSECANQVLTYSFFWSFMKITTSPVGSWREPLLVHEGNQPMLVHEGIKSYTMASNQSLYWGRSGLKPRLKNLCINVTFDNNSHLLFFPSWTNMSQFPSWTIKHEQFNQRNIFKPDVYILSKFEWDIFF